MTQSKQAIRITWHRTGETTEHASIVGAMAEVIAAYPDGARRDRGRAAVEILEALEKESTDDSP